MAFTTIDDPSVYFQILLYTGNSAARSVTNDGNSDLQPDWVWTKCRSNASDNFVFDSNRGVHKRLFTNTNAGEVSNTNALTAFNSDGFSMGNVGGMNFNNQTYVAWQWKANGGTTTTNDASSTSVGTIDSVYQANTTAGFSIVTYTGTGSAGTIAHGLGVAPTLIIGKDRDDTSQWFVQHPLNGATHYGELDDTSAFADDANYFNDSTPTSTVFGVGSDGATGGTTKYVAYCFAPIQGYSNFGYYKGNANADGPFVYTGFKPAWVMVKNTASAIGWVIQDSKRTPNNPRNKRLFANITDAVATDTDFDFLSTGFKLRNSGNTPNKNGEVYIYIAFAESPFVSSTGTPTTAT